MGAKRNKKLNYLLLIIALILIIFTIWTWVSKPLKIDILDVKFEVGEITGIDIDSSKLNFGRILKDSSVVRNVVVENEYEFPVKIDIFVTKNIHDYLFLNSKVVLPSKEDIKIPITLYVPKNIELGNYSGQIKFRFKRNYF